MPDSKLVLTQTHPSSRKRLVRVTEHSVKLIGTGTTFAPTHFFDVNFISDVIGEKDFTAEDAIAIIEDVKSGYENHPEGGDFSVKVIEETKLELELLRSQQV